MYQEDARPNFHVAPPVLLNPQALQAVRARGKWQYRPGDDDAWAVATLSDLSSSGPSEATSEQAIYSLVDSVDDVERYMTWREGDTEPLSPEEAEQGFQVPAGLELQLVLAEPHVAQPLFMTWDERGRLWVMEYRQYPEPAGLNMVSRDVYLRTVYDKVPAPPPHHDRGRDRISIHEDTDGDGIYDNHKVFVDGLNIATSMAIGRGGVWVTNPPYLLFYPDRNRDDIPDGDPEVHLQGFGLEDSHSVINSLRFGPDGWLYGAQGSTVSAAVSSPGSTEPPIRTMGQQIWRYQPELRQFEVFAEGGGNTFGVELDAKGRIYSGHNGGDTRGFHYVQGSYSRKGFKKHGSLSNPYAFGYFEPMKHHSVPRFTHNFILYEANVLPAPYRGHLFGIEPLQGQVVMSRFEPNGSSFQTHDLSRPVMTADPWFRPVDIKVGPDGCIYLADMYEQRIDHSSHYAGRIDRTNGRVYRLGPENLSPLPNFDLARLPRGELLDLLRHPSKWHRQEALRVLADRRDSELIPTLIQQLSLARGQFALEVLWALHLSGGLDDVTSKKLLSHTDRFVRAWNVRLVCDRGAVTPAFAESLAVLAAAEETIEVRKQLAASAQRLSLEHALPIIRNLLRHDADAKDIHQPLLIWWALEKHVGSAGDTLVRRLRLQEDHIWRRPLMRDHLLQRLTKRLVLPGTRRGLLQAAMLLESAPDAELQRRILAAFEEAYEGRTLVGLPPRLTRAIAAAGGGSQTLRMRQGDDQALQDAVRLILDDQAQQVKRIHFVEILAELGRVEDIPVLLEVAKSTGDSAVAAAALRSLQAYQSTAIGRAVVEQLPQFRGEVKLEGELMLASRAEWTILWLESFASEPTRAKDVSDAAQRKMSLHQDERVQQLVNKFWGTVVGTTTTQMWKEVRRIQAVVHAAAGNPKQGKLIFKEQCGKCHRLFDEGGDTGPDLTSFQRNDLERALVNIVNPNAEIREGFENHLLVTTDGRIVQGFVSDQDNQVVVLRDVNGNNHVVRRDEIDSKRALSISVMPEGTLRGLADQQLRDLFAYFRSSQPVNY